MVLGGFRRPPLFKGPRSLLHRPPQYLKEPAVVREFSRYPRGSGGILPDTRRWGFVYGYANYRPITREDLMPFNKRTASLTASNIIEAHYRTVLLPTYCAPHLMLLASNSLSLYHSTVNSIPHHCTDKLRAHLLTPYISGVI